MIRSGDVRTCRIYFACIRKGAKVPVTLKVASRFLLIINCNFFTQLVIFCLHSFVCLHLARLASETPILKAILMPGWRFSKN